MRIVGEWLHCDDGVTRPVMRAQLRDRDGQLLAERFLVDTGADRTVFRPELASALRLPVDRPSPNAALSGVGGSTSFLLVNTALEFVRDDGRIVVIRGEFAAFTDPLATDLSVLGRDVLDNFDLILSRRRNEVLLLAPQHQYHVSRTG